MKKTLTTGLLMSVFLISKGFGASSPVPQSAWEYEGVQIIVPGNNGATVDTAIYCASDPNFLNYGQKLVKKLIEERHASKLKAILEKDECLNKSIAFNFNPYAQSFVNYFNALLMAMGNNLAAAKAAKWNALPLNLKDPQAKSGTTFIPTFNLEAFATMPPKGKAAAVHSPYVAALNTAAATVPFDVPWLALFQAYNDLVHSECQQQIVKK